MRGRGWWGPQVCQIFDLSSPVHAYLLFRFAVTYAKWEFMARLLDKPFDTRELDTALLGFSGFLRGKRPATNLRLIRHFLSDLKRLRPEYLGDARTEELGSLGSLEELPVPYPHLTLPTKRIVSVSVDGVTIKQQNVDTT